MIGCRDPECGRAIALWRGLLTSGQWVNFATSHGDAQRTLWSAMTVCEVFHEQICTEFSKPLVSYRLLLLRAVQEAFVKAPRVGNLEYLGIEINHRRTAGRS